MNPKPKFKLKMLCNQTRSQTLHNFPTKQLIKTKAYMGIVSLFTNQNTHKAQENRQASPL